MNQVRIIAGKWRGKKIRFVDQEGLRPTPDRVRETLFNWLQQTIPGAHCLDLFAGSGALGIEAASRGAKSVCCVEASRKAHACMRDNIATLEGIPLNLVHADAARFLSQSIPEQKIDLVFLDPPFADKLLEHSCALLEKHHWLAEHALIYLESGQPLETLALPDNWRLSKNKKAGQVFYGLCQRGD